MTRLRRFLFGARSSRGAVAVEFALIFPVFIFMIFAMLDMGRYLIVQMSMNSAAQAGARAASMSATTSLISTATSSSSTGSIVRLSTLDANSDTTSIAPGAFVCPLNVDTVSDVRCVDQALPGATNCTSSPSNYAVIAVASVTFKWITPLDTILTFADPNNPPDNVWVNRGIGDTTTIEGRAKVLCQN
jgi:Flp pilus assembly protein TadG